MRTFICITATAMLFALGGNSSQARSLDAEFQGSDLGLIEMGYVGPDGTPKKMTEGQIKDRIAEVLNKKLVGRSVGMRKEDMEAGIKLPAPAMKPDIDSIPRPDGNPGYLYIVRVVEATGAPFHTIIIDGNTGMEVREEDIQNYQARLAQDTAGIEARIAEARANRKVAIEAMKNIPE